MPFSWYWGWRPSGGAAAGVGPVLPARRGRLHDCGRVAGRAFQATLVAAASAHLTAVAAAAGNDPHSAPAAPAAAPAQPPAADGKPAAVQYFDIDEYRVEGADRLAQIEVEEAVYPFLGPHRTSEDVEKARAALEKAYVSKGYQTVTISIPQQNVSSRVVVLKVAEGKVGRLRVNNARYFDLDKIKRKAPSLAEGTVPNFNAVTADIYALNQWPDRKITPALRAGETPGTVDVDLNVEDKLPFHGTVELNNRQSPNTEPLRLSATAHYDNLWQRGDSISFTYQVAPQRPADAEVFSGSYLARTDIDWLNILVYGVDSKSNVATVGDLNVVGPGQIAGVRAVITLPARDNLFHSLQIGVDYKHFDENVGSASQASFSSPVTYIPATATYTATFQGEGASTQLDAGVTFGLRGIPGTSDTAAFDQKRFDATGNFIYFRGDVSHTRDLPGGYQVFAKIQGQIADQPLVSSEQFSVGGVDTVRGYLESETLGDHGAVGTVELRTPNIGDWLAQIVPDESGKPRPITGLNEWRLFVFGDAGRAQTIDALPEQQAAFSLASYGVGTRFRVLDYANGIFTFAMPVISQTYTNANGPRVLFRMWGEF